MEGTEDEDTATPARTPRRRGWQPPRWVRIAYVVVVVALGVARIAISSTLLGRAFGVVLIALGLSYVRELRRSPAKDASPG